MTSKRCGPSAVTSVQTNSRAPGIAVEQAVVALVDEVLPGLGPRAAGEIGRRGDEDAAAVGDRADAQVRILERAEQDRHVEALGGDVELAVGEAQADVDLRVFVLEGGDQRRDQPLADAEGRRDVQRATRVLGEIGDGRLGLLDGLEDLAGALVEEAALLGRLQAARRAVEEPDAEMALELGDARARHRRRDALVARRPPTSSRARRP